MSRSSMRPAPPPTPCATPEFEVRPFRDRADFAACVELQRDTWGRSYSEIVPISMLQITTGMTGVAIGAFDPDGALLGFVYGVTGLRRGELAHWSHMLAVRSDARDRGIGRTLKLAQRRELGALGVRTMYWTYDPLVARNAHLNLNLLGATVDEYVQDMYGESDSLLHQLGTDRFIVRWTLGEDPVSRPPPQAHGPDEGPAALVWEPGTPGAAWPPDAATASARAPDTIAVRIPPDIEALGARSPAEALAWRHSTRAAFSRFLPGYRIRAFVRGPRHGSYLLVRLPPDRPA